MKPTVPIREVVAQADPVCRAKRNGRNHNPTREACQ